MKSAAKAPVQWLSVRAAAERLGVPLNRVRRLYRTGVIEILSLPRARPLVSSVDVERLARECRGRRPTANA